MGGGSMADADALALAAIARRDLLAARGMTDALVFHEAVWGFQVQQTIEKALKAWLYLSGVEPPFTHDLVALLKLLEEAGIDIAPYRELARFTDFAVQVRYDPGAVVHTRAAAVRRGAYGAGGKQPVLRD